MITKTEKKFKYYAIGNIRFRCEIETIDGEELDTNIVLQFTNNDGEICEKQIMTIEAKEIGNFMDEFKNLYRKYAI